VDITSKDDTSTQPISDDQELAKALAGITDEAEAPAPATPDPADADGMQFEESPAPGVTPANGTPVPVPDPTAVPADPAVDPATLIAPLPPAPAIPDLPDLSAFGAPAAMPPAGVEPQSGELTSIKQTALQELRPLIDRVDLPADERFDVYLMLIRSTDDTSLIGPAHQAAQDITDEKRRAQALLDIIKEIDFLSHPTQA